MPGKPILNIKRVAIILEMFAEYHHNAKCSCKKFKGARTKYDIECSKALRQQVAVKLGLNENNTSKLVALAYRMLDDPEI